MEKVVMDLSGMATRDVITMVADTTNDAIAKMRKVYNFPSDLTANHELRHNVDRTHRHVFGMGHSLRDTLVATYEPSTGRFGIIFPASYKGWNAWETDSYMRLRVVVYDDLCRTFIGFDKNQWRPENA